MTLGSLLSIGIPVYTPATLTTLLLIATAGFGFAKVPKVFTRGLNALLALSALVTVSTYVLMMVYDSTWQYEDYVPLRYFAPSLGAVAVLAVGFLVYLPGALRELHQVRKQARETTLQSALVS